ncbi:metallophosphoesterase family protein [Pseudomonas monsensis]|uniref:metallophosphoesterase n=1 Tax=Pseudomonas monsensis TaxID=2745509 RepID=UPI002AB8A954|nr:metallophosphoesterase [Pseudomonas monsensis]MDZ3826084.1 metallophosphoesterase [Pseudomonas monsensis]
MAVVYFMADNQERELFGDPTYYSARLAQDTSDVAIRSVEQDLYTKYVAESVMRRITQQDGTPPVIHLGDLLDYSCHSEFKRLKRLSFLSAPNVYIAKGNHDGIFQGNMSYGGWMGTAWLYIRKITVNHSIDPSLEGHFNAVCGQLDDNPLASDANRLRPFPDAREWPHQFNCDYLRLKSGGKLPLAIDTFCNASDYHRRVLVAAGKATPPLVNSQLTVHTPYEYTATMNTGNSVNKWNKGSLLQSVRVPLKQLGNVTSAELGVILLDTTDWPSVPSFKFLSKESNSNVGTIRQGQRDLVVEQLKSWRDDPTRSVKAVVLTGHYPLRALDRSSAQWMLKLHDEFPFVTPVYFSAHTHEGYTAVGDDQEVSKGVIREINVGSLIDAPVHYRKAIFSWDAERSRLLLTSELRTPWTELNCAADGSPQAKATAAGRVSAETYAHSKRFQPQQQWCERLTFAGRSMRDLAGQAVEEKDYAECTGSALRPTPDFLTRYRTAQASMDASLIGNIAEQERLACAALAGGKVFSFNKNHKPPETVSYAFDLAGGGPK